MNNKHLHAVYSVGTPYHKTLHSLSQSFFLFVYLSLTTCAPPLPGSPADAGAVVIQRRDDGSVDFDQTWAEYEKGFGDLTRKNIDKRLLYLYRQNGKDFLCNSG